MCKRLVVCGLFSLIAQVGWGQNDKAFCLQSGRQFVIACDTTVETKVVSNALQLFVRDCQAVMSVTPAYSPRQGDVWVGTVGTSPLIDQLIAENLLSVSELKGKKEAFQVSVLQRDNKPVLVVAGSDKRGTAYGVMEISRLMGVSPWEWWADVPPSPLPAFRLEAGFSTTQSPTVEFRGIFINDEDWGLMPWSSQTYEPTGVKGQIGPKTHQRIFELLLRLRANTFWPAMHACSRPFYFTPGNKEMADQYGIYIGTSHCEPMMRNSNGEWSVEGQGEYDYVNNRASVLRFWEQRVADVAKADNIYTLGIRGVHDGKMQGAKTLEEQKTALINILEDQRLLLGKYVNPDAAKVPQVFIPYKEVLDVYNTGLQVPEDVTLMWCDDNYGYIRHFPTEVERNRKGGNGVYYHVSYWGRPHDYLWLGTTHPSLIYQQMSKAYATGIQKMWILNVGDIKPAEYQIELFMDMAWDLNKVAVEGVNTHLEGWLKREFGNQAGETLLPVMKEHYRLAYIRKPEFMANTRTEEKDPLYKEVRDLPWSEQEIRERLKAYKYLSDEAEQVALALPLNKQDAYFELVQYPVQAADQMNRKLLNAQLARHGKAAWRESDVAFDSIASLTHRYNSLKGGKWNRMMDASPRRLPVFDRVKPQQIQAGVLAGYRKPLLVLNGTESVSSTGKPVIYEGLGYGEKAAYIEKGSSVTFSLDKMPKGSIDIELRLLPNHPVNGETLRLELTWDDTNKQVVEYQTQGRSEEWKENVLRNQAIRTLSFPIGNARGHTLRLKALDDGVILDQIWVYQTIKKGS